MVAAKLKILLYNFFQLHMYIVFTFIYIYAHARSCVVEQKELSNTCSQ